MVEKVEGDEAPDLTALTHLGLFLLANCWLWSTLRGHARTYIYLWTHTSDENILLVFSSACVGDVRVSLCRLESLHVTKVRHSVFVSFLPRCFFTFPSVVAAQQRGVVSPPPRTTPSSRPPRMCPVCEPLAASRTNEVIRNKCSKVQLLGRASPQRFLPTIPHHHSHRWSLTVTQHARLRK